uniref:Uncharacterized protein n=1 Tax=Avena sativa TaxID=4498 RepID=A0ACD5UM35_AVESA
MHFTHCTPGRIPSHAVVARTLQIYSIKVSQFKLPVEVYGVVAARDTVDHNRNILFRRERANCQILTEKDPFLRLTGPSRAIVSVDPVTFEILLKVKGRTKSEDQVMITDIFHYNGIYSGRLCSHVISKPLGKITLKFEQLEKTVQATILGICVVEGGWSWPFKHGGRVVCSSSPQEVMKIDNGTIFVTEPPDRQVVLLDYRGQKMPMGSNGYLDLPRQVVSVELGGSLKFLVQTYSESHEIAKEDSESHEIAKEDSKSHEIAKEGSVYFTPEKCNLSRGICDLGDFKVEITIAWSLLIGCKDSIFLQGYLP